MFDKLDKPDINLATVTAIIAQKTRSKESINHFLDKCTQDILNKSEAAYLNNDYSKLEPQPVVNNLTNSEAIYIYKLPFQNHVREKIFTQYLGCACPICGQYYDKMTLDHVLPKSEYTQYTVTPINLVPMCLNCNHRKGTSNISFHPYFQNLSCLPGISFIFSFSERKPVALKCDDKILFQYLEVYGMYGKLEIDANQLYKNISKILINKHLSMQSLENTLIHQRDDILDIPRWKFIFYNDLISNINDFWHALINF